MSYRCKQFTYGPHISVRCMQLAQSRLPIDFFDSTWIVTPDSGGYMCLEYRYRLTYLRILIRQRDWNLICSNIELDWYSVQYLESKSVNLYLKVMSSTITYLQRTAAECSMETQYIRRWSGALLLRKLIVERLFVLVLSAIAAQRAIQTQYHDGMSALAPPKYSYSRISRHRIIFSYHVHFSCDWMRI